MKGHRPKPPGDCPVSILPRTEIDQLRCDEADSGFDSGGFGSREMNVAAADQLAKSACISSGCKGGPCIDDDRVYPFLDQRRSDQAQLFSDADAARRSAELDIRSSVGEYNQVRMNLPTPERLLPEIERFGQTGGERRAAAGRERFDGSPRELYASSPGQQYLR